MAFGHDLTLRENGIGLDSQCRCGFGVVWGGGVFQYPCAFIWFPPVPLPRPVWPVRSAWPEKKRKCNETTSTHRKSNVKWNVTCTLSWGLTGEMYTNTLQMRTNSRTVCRASFALYVLASSVVST